MEHSPFPVSKLDQTNFTKLNDSQQAVIRAAMERTHAVIGEYLTGTEANATGALAELAGLATILDANTIAMCAGHLGARHTALARQAMHGFNEQVIKQHLGEVQADLQAIYKAFRKKSGDDAPLGDSVNLAEIGAAIIPEPETLGIVTFADIAAMDQALTGTQRRWQPAPHAAMPHPLMPRTHQRWATRQTKSPVLPAHMTPEFFKDLSDHLRGLEPEALVAVRAYCHGNAPFTAMAFAQQVTLGIPAVVDPVIKTALAAALPAEPALPVVETHYTHFTARYEALAAQQKATERTQNSPGFAAGM